MSRALIEDRVGEIRRKLDSIAGPNAVQLMAVTKYRTQEESLWAAEAGVDAIGENRIQEAVQKWQHLKPPVPLHAIGHVQTNKVKYGIKLFDSIDSLDSERLAEALDGRAADIMPVMIEVNIGLEASKSGLHPDQVRPFLLQLNCWPHLRADGLMTVLPARRENSVEESRRIRHYMQEMADLWRMCRGEELPWAPLTHLSMGMSGDWEWAVEAGSTMVRLGTSIFGPRPLTPPTAGAQDAIDE